MIDEKALDNSMKLIGYSRVSKFVYKAKFSNSAVDHYSYLSVFSGKPKEFLTLHFGFKNAHSDDFGVQCVKRYGGDAYLAWKPRKKYDCTMYFSFGEIAWPEFRAIHIRDLSQLDILHKLESDVCTILVPLVEKINSIDSFYKVLTSDDQYWPWVKTNSAIRAAQICYLSSIIGVSELEIRDFLSTRKNLISMQLRGLQYEEYIDCVIKDVIRADSV